MNARAKKMNLPVRFSDCWSLQVVREEKDCSRVKERSLNFPNLKCARFRVKLHIGLNITEKLRLLNTLNTSQIIQILFVTSQSIF